MLNIIQREQNGKIYTRLLLCYCITKIEFRVFTVKKYVPSFLASIMWHEIEKVVQN